MVYYGTESEQVSSGEQTGAIPALLKDKTMSQQSRLIIIRGNSASGKSTLAKRIRAQTGRRTALVEQDYLRRTVLAEIGPGKTADNIDLIEQTAMFALERGYDVIVEGILTYAIYGAMLRRLTLKCACYLIYYLDVPFDETVRRHATKPVAQEYGENELRQWWLENDVTGFPGEKIISDSASLDEMTAIVLSDLKTVSATCHPAES